MEKKTAPIQLKPTAIKIKLPPSKKASMWIST